MYVIIYIETEIDIYVNFYSASTVFFLIAELKDFYMSITYNVQRYYHFNFSNRIKVTCLLTGYCLRVVDDRL